jgi:hypothetical protein
MHNVRSHRRLARMTGREVPSAEVLFDRLDVRDAHIVGRGPTRVSYPNVKLGNKDPDVTPTYVYLPFILTSLSSRTICPAVHFPG